MAKALAIGLSIAAGLSGNGACTTPPEAEVIGGLPCDHGACASGYVCDPSTQKCVVPGASPGGGGVDAGRAGAAGSVSTGGGAGSGGASDDGAVPSAGGLGGGPASGGVTSRSGGAGGRLPGGGGAPDSGPGAEATCDDGRRNGTETAVDCGGPACDACPTGSGCAIDLDCASRRCTPGDAGEGRCAAPSCSDGVVNGSESGLDCGGGTCSTCADGAPCHDASDCTSTLCLSGVCAAAGCIDGQKNGTESDTDCGGASCPSCLRGAICKVGSDCASGVCKAAGSGGGRLCQIPTCGDGVRNGTESDKDCGGPACTACVAGKLCTRPGDCESGSCVRVYSLTVCEP